LSGPRIIRISGQRKEEIASAGGPKKGGPTDEREGFRLSEKDRDDLLYPARRKNAPGESALSREVRPVWYFLAVHEGFGRDPERRRG
jgi:hypothetical protein